MSKLSKRQTFDRNLKAKVALEELEEKLTLSELAAKYVKFFPPSYPIEKMNLLLKREIYLRILRQ